MPNHWHLVLWPREEGELTAFLRWLTHTHSMRWHAHYHTSGTGHLYQGRFKSFPVQTDEHFYTLVRYVERNALRAHLVERAEDWRWCSLWRREFGDKDQKKLLHPWPLPQPRRWIEMVNEPQSEAEVKSVRQSVREAWFPIRDGAVASAHGAGVGFGMDAAATRAPSKGDGLMAPVVRTSKQKAASPFLSPLFFPFLSPQKEPCCGDGSRTATLNSNP